MVKSSENQINGRPIYHIYYIVIPFQWSWSPDTGFLCRESQDLFFPVAHCGQILRQ